VRVSWHTLATAASIALLLPLCGFGPSAAQSPSARIGADIIVTAAPAYEPLAALRGRERFPKGAQLLLVHEGNAQPPRTPMFRLMPRLCSSRASRPRTTPGRYGN
jgi:hypothetical protein